jgi:hypothetical protein
MLADMAGLMLESDGGVGIMYIIFSFQDFEIQDK